MTYIISVILIFFNSIFANIKKHGKFISFLLVLFMWVLYWSNNYNPDYIEYLRMYKSMEVGASIFSPEREFGYGILMKIFVTIGLDFDVFIMIDTFICYCLIHSTVKKYCDNYNYVYLLYFIFPFFIDVVQIRNFIVMSILIYSIRYLIEDYNIANIKYLFLILIASTIHIFALAYIPFILIKIDKNKYLIRGIIFFTIFNNLIVLLNDRHIPFVDTILTSIFRYDKIIFWLNSRTNWGFLVSWFMQIFSFSLVYFSIKLLRNHSQIIKENKLNSYYKHIKFIEVVYLINLISFIYFPLYILGSTYTRLIRNVLVLNYTSFAIINDYEKGQKRLMFNSLVIIYVLFHFISQLYIPYKDIIINSILQNNILMRGW